MRKLRLKLDEYRKRRGGASRLITLRCEKCGCHICDYQKDGAGVLKRLYVDRILKPKIEWRPGKRLICSKCGRWLALGAIASKTVGAKSLYPNEHRRCFILFQASVKKN